MRQKKPDDRISELTEEQLDKVSAGAPSKPPSSKLASGSLFGIDDFSFDIEQTLNIGSQSSGAGADK